MQPQRNRKLCQFNNDQYCMSTNTSTSTPCLVRCRRLSVLLGSVPFMLVLLSN